VEGQLTIVQPDWELHVKLEDEHVMTAGEPVYPVAHVTAHCELAEVEQPDASTYPVDADGVGQAPEPPGMTVIFNILM